VLAGVFPRIFIVDDEYITAATLATLLQMNGFSARFFTCPLEALNAARLDNPDLLISDLEMPRLCGIDLAIQLRAQHPDCRILLLSADAAATDSLRDVHDKRHDFRFLLKPVHPSQLFSAIGTSCVDTQAGRSREEVKAHLHPSAGKPANHTPTWIQPAQNS
jgi:CheY-like chemotaxis protein